ncbi:hypothetical protein [Thermosulfurimonas dismutans]|uniref:Uncharacterized protein n=1 Tax=Thermosulfurimonas dismutans TaxID=999894 RepID=A0A179D7B8_9BACT|nr:hypothetical protein [Thermosulfurimonas dismutans]OAQ21853.1 hypothetical protein TDIS_0371 [Thermosulfurimonas dismutans]
MPFKEYAWDRKWNLNWTADHLATEAKLINDLLAQIQNQNIRG